MIFNTNLEMCKCSQHSTCIHTCTFIRGEFPPALALSCSTPSALPPLVEEKGERSSSGCCLLGGCDEGLSPSVSWMLPTSAVWQAQQREPRVQSWSCGGSRPDAARKERSPAFSSLSGEPEAGSTVPCVSALCCPCGFLKPSEPVPVTLCSQTQLSHHIPGAAVIPLEKTMEEEENSV